MKKHDEQYICTRATNCTLGRCSQNQIIRFCKQLKCKSYGTKKEMIQHIHQVLNIPFREDQYDMVGWKSARTKPGKESEEEDVEDVEEEDDEETRNKKRMKEYDTTTDETSTLDDKVEQVIKDIQENVSKRKSLVTTMTLSVQHISICTDWVTLEQGLIGLHDQLTPMIPTLKSLRRVHQELEYVQTELGKRKQLADGAKLSCYHCHRFDGKVHYYIVAPCGNILCATCMESKRIERVCYCEKPFETIVKLSL